MVGTFTRGRARPTKKKGEGGSADKRSTEPTNDGTTTSTEPSSTIGDVKGTINNKKKSVNKKKAKTPEKEKSNKFIKSKRNKKTNVKASMMEPPKEHTKESASMKGYSQAALDAMERYRQDIMGQTGRRVRDEWNQVQGIGVSDPVPPMRMVKSFDPTVPCSESTRVKADGVDFYHANWFKMPESGVKDPRFLLAQVPTPQGIEDFWQAVFQSEPCLMFILTPLYENGSGIECFFPIGLGEYKNFGNIMVHNKKEEKFEFGTSYTFEVLPSGCSNALMLRTFHFEQWAQNRTPVVKGLLSMMQTCRYDAESTAPIVCVSRRGTGRSGLLAAAVIMYNRLIQGTYTPLVEIVAALRRQRAGGVDNLAQYCYIEFAIISYIKRRAPPKNVPRWTDAGKHSSNCWQEAETLY